MTVAGPEIFRKAGKDHLRIRRRPESGGIISGSDIVRRPDDETADFI